MAVIFDERIHGALRTRRNFDTMSGDPGQKAMEMAREVGVVIDPVSVIESNLRAEKVIHLGLSAGQQAIKGSV